MPTINKKVLGPFFKKNAKDIEDTIMSMSQDCLQKLQKGLEAGKATVSANGETFEVTKEHVEVEYKTIKE
ncbi:hypothetical protein K3V85_14705, partial [Listeria monocytogenes]|nr:hypothetical protein [Listeria monocytogenes]